MPKDSILLRTAHLAPAMEAAFFSGTTNPLPRLNIRASGFGTILGYLEISDVGNPSTPATEDDPVYAVFTLDLTPQPTWSANGTAASWEIVNRDNQRMRSGTSVVTQGNLGELVLLQDSLIVAAGAQILVGSTFRISFPAGSF